MSKSNIALAIIAGSVIGGIIALVLKTEDALFPDYAEDEFENDRAKSRTQTIARQFSDRISTDLDAAEMKIKSAFKKDSAHTDSSGERGVFL